MYLFTHDCYVKSINHSFSFLSASWGRGGRWVDGRYVGGRWRGGVVGWWYGSVVAWWRGGMMVAWWYRRVVVPSCGGRWKEG